MTSIPVDNAPTEVELLTEVHRLVEEVVQLARAECGPIPGVRSPAWWTAPLAARIAAILILGEAYLVFDPERAVEDRLKAMSVDLSQAHDWTAAAWRPSHSGLSRRREEPGPLTGYLLDPVGAAQWVATGNDREGAA